MYIIPLNVFLFTFIYIYNIYVVFALPFPPSKLGALLGWCCFQLHSSHLHLFQCLIDQECHVRDGWSFTTMRYIGTIYYHFHYGFGLGIPFQKKSSCCPTKNGADPFQMFKLDLRFLAPQILETRISFCSPRHFGKLRCLLRWPDPPQNSRVCIQIPTLNICKHIHNLFSKANLMVT